MHHLCGGVVIDRGLLVGGIYVLTSSVCVCGGGEVFHMSSWLRLLYLWDSAWEHFQYELDQYLLLIHSRTFLPRYEPVHNTCLIQCLLPEVISPGVSIVTNQDVALHTSSTSRFATLCWAYDGMHANSDVTFPNNPRSVTLLSTVQCICEELTLLVSTVFYKVIV